MTELVANEPSLAGRVYIPKVYPEYSTKKVMTAEWIDGVRLSDRGAIRRLMGEGRQDDLIEEKSKGGKFEGVRLKGGVKAVMQTMVDLFSAQMFEMGWVHCDPHPGKCAGYICPCIIDICILSLQVTSSSALTLGAPINLN